MLRLPCLEDCLPSHPLRFWLKHTFSLTNNAYTLHTHTLLTRQLSTHTAAAATTTPTHKNDIHIQHLQAYSLPNATMLHSISRVGERALLIRRTNKMARRGALCNYAKQLKRHNGRACALGASEHCRLKGVWWSGCNQTSSNRTSRTTDTATQTCAQRTQRATMKMWPSA